MKQTFALFLLLAACASEAPQQAAPVAALPPRDRPATKLVPCDQVAARLASLGDRSHDARCALREASSMLDRCPELEAGIAALERARRQTRGVLDGDGSRWLVESGLLDDVRVWEVGAASIELLARFEAGHPLFVDGDRMVVEGESETLFVDLARRAIDRHPGTYVASTRELAFLDVGNTIQRIRVADLSPRAPSSRGARSGEEPSCDPARRSSAPTSSSTSSSGARSRPTTSRSFPAWSATRARHRLSPSSGSPASRA